MCLKGVPEVRHCVLKYALCQTVRLRFIRLRTRIAQVASYCVQDPSTVFKGPLACLGLV